MKRLSLLIVMAAGLTQPLLSQRTVVELTKSSGAVEDAKENSRDVPDVYAVSADVRRVVILRLKYKTDLLAGLEKGIAQEGVKNAVILAAAGSLRGYHIHAVSNREFPSRNVYMKDLTHPVDVISMNGYVIDGRVHPHITLADEDGAFGGHLEPGSEVFTFAVITLGVLADDVDLSRVDDKTYR